MNQTYKNYEVIFVDAGSTDGSVAYVQKAFPEIKIIRCGRIGIGEAVNVGFRNSDGDIIVFDFNTDEYVQPDWMEELIKHLEHYHYNIISGTTRLIYGTNLIDEAGVDIDWLGRAKKKGHWNPLEQFDFKNKPVDFVGSPTFHRKILNRIGYVDEEYFIYAEDMDFCHRAKLNGIETYCAPLARSCHQVRGTMANNSQGLEYYLRRANMRFHLLYSSPLKIFANLFYVGIFLTISSLMVSALNLKRSPLYFEKFLGRMKAVFWILKNSKNTLDRRKEVNDTPTVVKDRISKKA